MESVSKSNIKMIKEGSAEIYGEGNVFYNPVQQFNRDLSISVLSTFSNLYNKEKEKKAKSISINSTDQTERNDNSEGTSKNQDNLKYGLKNENGITILEALSATGLRSIRYAKEVPGIKQIIANDLSRQAVASILENVKHNKVEEIVTPHEADAMYLMYTNTSPDKRFTVIDLDPYGCPSRFLDGAVQSITDGGLLLVTATDMAVLAGNTPEACYVKYGSVPLKTKACHEMALRILLRTIESNATRYGRYIQPLLSISADFYIRVFVRVFTSPLACKRSSSKQSMVYQCTGCDTLTFQPLGILKPNPSEKNPNQVKFGIPTGPYVNTNCDHCGFKHHMGGPIWTAPIHDAKFIDLLLTFIQSNPLQNLATQKRMLGMITVVKEELIDIPLYYSVEKLCSILKLETMPILRFRSALLHAKYRVSFSHACKSSIKTDAPMNVLWDILRCWAKRHPVKPERMLDGTPLKIILSKPSENEYDFFDIHPLANPTSRKEALVRFPENPAAHWGPGTRATLMIGDNKMMKSIRNQNKKCKRSDHHESDDDDDADADADRKSATKHVKMDQGVD